MSLTYSKYFKVKHRDFLQKGVYNASLDQDSLLHIDPLLLKGSAIPEFTNAYTEFFNYFRLFIPLVKASGMERMKENLNIFDFEINREDMSILECMPQNAWLGEHPDFCIPKAKSNFDQ